MSPPLTPDQRTELRELLERELDRLLRSLERTTEATRPVELDQTAVGRLSRMDSLLNQGIARNLKDREEAKLSLLRAALERHEQGTYGLCESCGETIAYGRLLIVPEAATCAGCG